MSATSHRAGGWITVDWTIIALSLLAIGLLFATTIRTDPTRLGTAGDAGTGLRILTAQERLVAFEDFSFGTHGWTIAGAEDAGDAVPGLLGPFRGGSISKAYVLPPGTTRASLTLDLYLPDDAAADALVIDLNGAPLLRGLAAPADDASGSVISVRAPDGSGPRTPWTVRIDLPDPGAELKLGVQGPETDEGIWGLDNVWVVAEGPGLSS
jgi:hypothetical protein